MTQFTIAIIPHNQREPIDVFLNRQMNPYDSKKLVAPYVSYSITQAGLEIERDIRRIERNIERQDPGFDPKMGQQQLNFLRSTTPEMKYREYIEQHQRFDSHGRPLSIANPQGKWDSWRYGEYWDGPNYGRNERSNCSVDELATTDELLASGEIPHAIITPDGRWHERGELGEWATLVTENENWNTDAREILSRYPKTRVLMIQAHIGLTARG